MRKRKNILILLLSAVTLFSCENWLDVNKSDDDPQTVDYEDLLPSGITSIAYVMGGRFQVLGALWSQHWTQSPGASQYSGLDSYDINSSTFDDRQFGELYSGALMNLEEVRNRSLAENEVNYYLMATVTQCYIYQVLSDLYNKIPFSEALKGELVSEPRYEDASDIYDSLIVRLDYALSLDFDREGLKDPEEKDLLFNGDIKQWIAFANTLKLRIYLRQTEVNPVKAQQGIVKMYDEEVDFLTQDAMLNIYSDGSGKRNPLYDTDVHVLGNNPNLILSNTLYSFLLDNGDFTRLDYLFNKPASGGGHKALVQGNYYAPEETSGINSSSYSKPFMSADEPVYLMSTVESNFIQAEAIIRYNVDDYETAKSLYDEAIKSSYRRILEGRYPDNTGQIDKLAEGFVNGPYAFPAEGSSLDAFVKSIATQKWLSLSGIQNLETFLELNRTGYPAKSPVPADDPGYRVGELTVSVNNVTSGKFPKRLIFPESEYANNRNTPDKKEVWENIWWDNN